MYVLYVSREEFHLSSRVFPTSTPPNKTAARQPCSGLPTHTPAITPTSTPCSQSLYLTENFRSIIRTQRLLAYLVWWSVLLYCFFTSHRWVRSFSTCLFFSFDSVNCFCFPQSSSFFFFTYDRISSLFVLCSRVYS